MKSSIAQIASIYGPVVKKQRQKPTYQINKSIPKNDNSVSNISLIQKKPIVIKKENSLRTLSVIKRRDSHFNLRRDSRSVEPLPLIKSVTPLPSKQQKLFSVDSSLDEEFKRLDGLILKNHSARNDLLLIQKRILSLGVNKLIKDRKFCDGNENISFERIDESLRDPCVLKVPNLEHRSSEVKLKLPSLCSL
ncbi:unnamed protein product [Blepharisma stoltei]|uniref:Uncharacterized protein n=1 Tax=Blepharisma stoltei TaxID=1481888 RepID=A0AAU9IS66_9CILI|nr:unnamed protein product [Blepharisma stoltei]